MEEASKCHTCICKDTGIFQAQVAVGADLYIVKTSAPVLLLVSWFYLHVNTGDSMSWTSLSTWIRMLTVMSNSPLCYLLDSVATCSAFPNLTKSEASYRPAHKLGPAGTKKRLLQHCGTSI